MADGPVGAVKGEPKPDEPAVGKPNTLQLIIQIPCYNQERTLLLTLDQLPREIPGFDVVEVLVIDDGSEDGTVRVARAPGVDHVVRSSRQRDLAYAFTLGMQASLAASADVVVNTDPDNQYRAEDNTELVRPVLDQGTEMVIGEPPIDEIEHLSVVKKRLQRLLSWVVRKVSATRA